MKTLTPALLLVLGLGCTPSVPPPSPAPSPIAATTPPASPSPSPSVSSNVEPEHITVQHILISFTGKVPKAKRSQAEAKELAEKVFTMVQSGENFDDLVKKYTDDSPPGIYKMANKGVKESPGEYNRMGMVGAFGNVGFKLGVGAIGMAPYDAKDSPYGWHIIKRLK